MNKIESSELNGITATELYSAVQSGSVDVIHYRKKIGTIINDVQLDGMSFDDFEEMSFSEFARKGITKLVRILESKKFIRVKMPNNKSVFFR